MNATIASRSSSFRPCGGPESSALPRPSATCVALPAGATQITSGCSNALMRSASPVAYAANSARTVSFAFMAVKLSQEDAERSRNSDIDDRGLPAVRYRLLRQPEVSEGFSPRQVGGCSDHLSI